MRPFTQPLSRCALAVLLSSLFGVSASVEAQEPISPGELGVVLHVGVSRRQSELRPLRGPAYGLDFRYRFVRHATLELGCHQARTSDGTAETQLLSWRTACGAVVGGGYRGQRFFVGAAVGVDLLISTHAIIFGSETSRTWTLRPVGRVDLSALYVHRRYRLGLRGSVRLASEYVDARFLLSIGYAFRELD